MEFSEAMRKDKIYKIKVETKMPKYIIKHNGKLRMKWDLCVIILALYNCVMIPMNVSFSNMGFTGKIIMN